MKIFNHVLYKNVVVFALAAVTCATSFYGYNSYQVLQKVQTQFTSEKSTILKELKKYKHSLDSANIKNAENQDVLRAELFKVSSLLSDINSNKDDFSLLFKYKSEVERLKTVVLALTREKNYLQNMNTALKKERDSTIVSLQHSKKAKDTLLQLNKTLNKSIRLGSQISIVDLNAATYKKSTSGTLALCDKARKVNMFQISYLAIGSKISKPCTENYFIQIIDAKNNLIGNKKTKKFGNLILDYSLDSPVHYKGETVKITETIDIENVDKGVYSVNIFDEQNLILKTTFTLH